MLGVEAKGSSRVASGPSGMESIFFSAAGSPNTISLILSRDGAKSTVYGLFHYFHLHFHRTISLLDTFLQDIESLNILSYRRHEYISLS